MLYETKFEVHLLLQLMHIKEAPTSFNIIIIPKTTLVDAQTILSNQTK